MVGVRTPNFRTYEAVSKVFSRLSVTLTVSPGLVGLESDRLLLLGAESVSSVVL